MKTRYLLDIPFVSLQLENQYFEFLLDTGFNGSLMLSKTIINQLNLPYFNNSSYFMADGSLNTAELYHATINWLGSTKQIVVVAGEMDLALVGTGLLKTARTIIDPKKNVLKIEAS